MLKIIIVEDEEIIRKGLVHTIDWMSLGCSVIADAANGEEGLNSILLLRPDLVISDIRMPMLDGLEMIEMARAQYYFEAILLTSYGEFEYANKAIKLGVFDYILKPLDEEILMDVISRVKDKISEQRIVRDVKEQVKDIEDVKIIDMDMFRKSSNNNLHVDKVIGYIMENYNKKITFEEVAEQLGVSSSYLSRKIKEVTNQTFLDILNKYRIQKSIELLMNGNNRIYEVAYLVGFSEYKHFCTVFKKYTNVPPTKFTKSNMYLAKK